MSLGFSFTVVPREIEDNAYAKSWGANKLCFGRSANGEYGESDFVVKKKNLHFSKSLGTLQV